MKSKNDIFYFCKLFLHLPLFLGIMGIFFDWKNAKANENKVNEAVQFLTIPAFKTINLSLQIEQRKHHDANWIPVGRKDIQWDVENNKYKVFQIIKGKDNILDVRTYYCVDDKWTVIFSKYSDAGNLTIGRKIERSTASICNSASIPFGMEFAVFGIAENFNQQIRILQQKDFQKMKILSPSPDHGISVFYDEPQYKDKSRMRRSYLFNRDGRIIGKINNRVSENGEILWRGPEFIIDWDNEKKNEKTFFPKCIIQKNHLTGQAASHIAGEIRYTFIAPELNLVYPAGLFVPIYEHGTLVTDFFINKSFIATDKNYREEVDTKKKLDALFEEAEKQRKEVQK